MLTVLLGGARSGKSSLAVELGRRHDGPVVYIATSPRIAGDDDLDDRIEQHRRERPAAWATVEAEVELAEALGSIDEESMVIIDCLTVWVGSLMHHGRDEAGVLSACADVLRSIQRRGGPTIAISNEVGLGIVPANELGRRYRDALGRVNQRFANAADRSLLLVAGRAIDLRDPWELLG